MIDTPVQKSQAVSDRRPIIFVVAAEPSGDALGAPILDALSDLAPGRYRYVGIGGEQMIEAGLEPIFPMADITAFGLAEVLPRIPTILRRLKETEQAIRLMKPSLLLTIDGPDHSFRLAKKLRNLSMPKMHLVAPTVWAWRPKRAAKVAKLYDHLLCLFPFEPPYFEAEGMAASFIGHPLVTGPAMSADGDEFRQRHGIPSDQRLITVLPGSRRGEVEKLSGVFGEALGLLRQRIGSFTAVIPTVGPVADLVRANTEDWPVDHVVVQGIEDKYGAMAASKAGLAASGTVALELALTGLPGVIAYRANPISAAIFRRLALTQYVSLPNIILQRPLIPECLQEDCTPNRLADELEAMCKFEKRRDSVLDGYKQVAEKLGAGQLDPATMAAKTLLKLAASKPEPV
ncbi:MAG: lipid-A-disaccharide synthase [Alphaproteobacteria bacterium]|nr:lipid-A-disaccharide synthase [Alphaproteobacteria bacterium SS10]